VLDVSQVPSTAVRFVGFWGSLVYKALSDVCCPTAL
jgi:hypothetical protein